VHTTIQSGVATDSNGRVWDTGSGATIKPGISPIYDTRTVTVDTQTATTDSKTATTSSTGTISSNSTPLEVKTSIPDPAKVQRITNNLSTKAAEAQLVARVVSSKQSSIQINTDFSNSLLQISATKKGTKPINFLVETNSKGDAKLTVKNNLTGYTVTLAAGATKLDIDKIKG
jgi:Leucine-rich repeat (LRR) protein